FWVFESGNKSLLIIGTNNAIHYQEVFPLIQDNKLWLGATCNNEDMVFAVPEGAEVSPSDKKKAEKMGFVGNYTRLGNSCWFTNLEHGRRHQWIPLMTLSDNIKFSKHNNIRENGYQKYINYDAIEVPYVDAIPLDYGGDMGVPVTFMDKYCPEQFIIIGTEAIVRESMDKYAIKGEYNPGGNVLYIEDTNPDAQYKYKAVYKRIIIRRKL
ncbi:MAG: adenine-specific methyltransferase EcoRI family protein, partial [Candidatus Paracaedibacteraceae bacterium]|nr:adenine-specific methyltransferase EcoRI family protein [Candidatus Paracaedibacteraceae bacterium]